MAIMIGFPRSVRFLACSVRALVPKILPKNRWLHSACQTCTRLKSSAATLSYLLDCSKLKLQSYKSQEQYFKKKIRASYKRFSEIQENTVIQGRHHVYFEEGGNIYRMGLGQRDEEVQSVLVTGSGETLQRVRLSPGERALAATVKGPQSEETKCLLVRLADPPQSPELLLELHGVFSFEWASDEVLFYTNMENLQCHYVFRLDLREETLRGVLVYEEQDPEFFVEVSSTRNKRLVTLNCTSKCSSEVWLIESNTPLGQPRLIQPRLPGLLYHVEHWNKHLYILASTAAGQEYQLVRALPNSPSLENWEPVFIPVPGTSLVDMELLQDHCILIVRTPEGPLGLHVVPLANPSQAFAVQLPLWACAFDLHPMLGLERQCFQFLLSSPVHPPVQFSYPLREKQLFVQEDNTQHPPLDDFHTTRLDAVSLDGTLVPLTVFHKTAWDDLVGAPLLVHVYGAYGLSLPMAFRPDKRVLLEDGWVLAYCHVRGGGERGLGWHHAGRLCQKRRGLEDLEACVRRLFDLGVSCPERAVLYARSAGAVLAGALCNEQPQLLRAVILQAPFLDVLGTMEDPGLPLTIEERAEWGDPLADSRQRDGIISYCPCHNIRRQRYPSVLITAYEGDTRVPLAGVLRYAERLTAAVSAHTTEASAGVRGSESSPSIVLDIQPGGDHFGPEDVAASLNETARHFAFLYSELGLDCRHHGQKNK